MLTHIIFCDGLEALQETAARLHAAIPPTQLDAVQAPPAAWRWAVAWLADTAPEGREAAPIPQFVPSSSERQLAWLYTRITGGATAVAIHGALDCRNAAKVAQLCNAHGVRCLLVSSGWQADAAAEVAPQARRLTVRAKPWTTTGAAWEAYQLDLAEAERAVNPPANDMAEF